MRILHVLDHSLPYLSAYSYRSSAVISRQRRLGATPVVLTSPRHETVGGACELDDGVEHHRSRWPLFHLVPLPQSVPLVRDVAFVAALAARIVEISRHKPVDLIHAHSPALIGLAARRAARKLGIPWLYELHYYEHDAAVESGRMRRASLAYQKAEWLEARVVNCADAVVTNAASLRQDLISRGVAPHKLFEAPNGVDTKIFHPREPDAELIRRFGLGGKTVVGFVGSFYRYEGLENLIGAMLHVLRERRDFKVLLAGAGEAEASLRAHIPREWREHFLFAGRIEQEDVPRYYTVMDMVVYPRVSTRLTELTTSTRPLEAMAMERPVIASGVGGMAELIRHGKTGYLVETDSWTTLAAWILRLASQRAGRLMVGVNARAFVVEHHDWERIAERYMKLYSPLLATGSSPLSPETVAAGWPDECPPEPRAESCPKQY